MYRREIWRKNNYISLNQLFEGSSSEEEEEEEEEGSEDISYVMGDVTQPQGTGSNDAIIVHCVGGCGKDYLSWN